jgi:hypothetical protein
MKRKTAPKPLTREQMAVKALADALVCIRDRPEFWFETRQIASVLTEYGIERVCNRDLAEDLRAENRHQF